MNKIIVALGMSAPIVITTHLIISPNMSAVGTEIVGTALLWLMCGVATWFTYGDVKRINNR